jgi:hypothetical protein
MNYQALIAGRLVRTFNHPELAEAYAERMRVIGATVEVRRIA